jgi:DNA replication initiation complex subunit (GINS family)
MDSDYFDELRKIQRRERKVSLSQIPDGFYELAAKFIHSLELEKKWKERENAYLVLKDIYERRREKIIKAALKYSITEKPQYMTKDEERFYSSILEIVKADERQFEEILSLASQKEKIFKEESKKEMSEESKTKELIEREKEEKAEEKIGKIEKIEEKKEERIEGKEEGEEKVIKVYIEKNIDRFLGLNGKIYGPYKEGDIVEVGPDEAKILLKLKVAKEII